MNHLRLRTKLGLIVGILVGCVMAVAVVGYRGLGEVSRELQEMVEVTARMTMLASDLRDGVALTRRKQFRAVITFDDAQSQEFAGQARGTAKQMEIS